VRDSSLIYYGRPHLAPDWQPQAEGSAGVSVAQYRPRQFEDQPQRELPCVSVLQISGPLSGRLWPRSRASRWPAEPIKPPYHRLPTQRIARLLVFMHNETCLW